MQYDTETPPLVKLVIFDREFWFVDTVRPSRLMMFLEKVNFDVDGGCWNWDGCVTSQGYGVLYWDKKKQPAHRQAWMMFRGPIPSDFHIHHICENRRCVNPDHLLPVTPREHVNDYTPLAAPNINAQKTHCSKGHPLEGDNIYNPPGTNKRVCRICKKAWGDAKRKERGMVPGGSKHKQTHCKRGHELTEENLTWYGGQRYCKKCHAINARGYYDKLRSEMDDALKKNDVARISKLPQYWTHCKNGHLFSPENTMIVKYGERESRRCRTCYKANAEKRAEKIRKKQAELRGESQ